MLRYLRLLKIFYKASLLTELEYRANFVVHGLFSIGWTAWVWFGLAVFYQHRPTLAGWSYHEALLVVGMFQVFSGLIEALLRPNIQAIIEHVRKGTLDFVLLKPLDSQFFVSTRQIVFWKLLDMLVGFGVVGYALLQLGVRPGIGALAMFVIMFVLGAVMLYSVWIALITSAFWFVRVDNISELIYSFFEAGRFPVNVFRGAVRFVLTFIVPIAFMTTFPAAVLIDKLDWRYVWLAGPLALGLFGLSVWFWRFALRFYTSASS
ncbi:MAG TPA: ABC-2 family transporter protein [Herpetosiphonaceae bacterium]